MGYTHYWTLKKRHDPETWKNFRSDVTKLLHLLKSVPFFTQTNLKITSKITPDFITLNGLPDCESLLLKRDFDVVSESVQKYMIPFEGGISFGFCKTRRLPYDVVVVATLTLYKYHFKDTVFISSDGSAEDFSEGVSLVNKIFNYKILPNSILE